MGDAMTTETIRAALHEMAQMEFVGRMLDREYHAALALALAALDAGARVRALHVGRDLSDGLHHACRACELPFPCPTIRALDGEAAR